MSEEEYAEAARRRGDVDDPLVCFIGQGCTFGGKWFGGYARGHPRQREPIRAAARTLLERVASTRETVFLHQPYWDLDVLPGDVVYCDPPYRDTTQDYPVEAFDHERFWSWARALAEDGADVFVSEFTAPTDIGIFWEKEVPTQTRRAFGSTKVERLYHIPAKSETEEPIMPTYPTLPVEAFGRQLIESGDLDPVYVALAGVDWPEEQRKRFLVAYWLFYHPGAACYMSAPGPADLPVSGADFWSEVRLAAVNSDDVPSPVNARWPRASERRHFRGDKAVRAVDELARRFPGGHELVDFLAEAAPDYATLFNRVCSLPQFGPWMAFKCADMLERVLGVHVDFDLASVTMFDDPRKAALMVWRKHAQLPDSAKSKQPDATIKAVVSHLIVEFAGLTAPPAHDRAVGYQEVETVLCKWKSHVNGHYPVGKDTREIRAGLAEWAAVSEAAREFLHFMPTGATPGAIPA